MKNSKHFQVGIFVALSLLFSQGARAEVSHTPYDKLLGEYVSDGVVDYVGLLTQRSALSEYLKTLEKVERRDFDGWSNPDQLAFLINLYNGQTLRLILDHYPVKSIKHIREWLKGPWDIEFFKLFEKKRSLGYLEHDVIRKEFRDPRVHFALVCASKGCPPLRNEAYEGTRLEEQLADQTFEFLSDKKFNRVDSKKNRLYLSPIFKWYREDFDGEAGILKFVDASIPGPDNSGNFSDYAIKYTHYDWSLNGKGSGNG